MTTLYSYEANGMKVRTVVGKETGYGWLAYRFFEAMRDMRAEVTVYVLPPRDAVLVFGDEIDVERGNGRAVGCLCAVDGTEIPDSWRKVENYFDFVVVMLEHSDFQWSKIIGSFYPLPRTFFLQEKFSDRIVGERKVDRKVLGTVLGAHARKNLETIVSVAYSLYKMRADVEFEIVADARTAWLWKHYAPPNLKFRTRLSDYELTEWYLSLWAFFSFSMGEGGALPVVEASTLNTPTILPYHTAFKFLPASLYLSCTEIVAQGDPNIQGKLYLVNPKEFIDIVLNQDCLPQPPRCEIDFENVSKLREKIASCRG